MTNRSHDWWIRAALLALVLVVAVVVRAALAPFPGHPFDLSLFLAWAQTIREHGLTAIYDIAIPPYGLHVNYPPLFLYVLWGLAHALPTLSIALVKLPAIAVDLVLGGVAWYALRTQSVVRQLVATTFVLLNPALFLVSSFWGQIDNLYVLFSVFAVWAATRKQWVGAGALTALAICTKPQAIVIAPILIAFLIRLRDRRVVYRYVGGAALTSLLVFAPFFAAGGIMAFARPFLSVVKQYAYLSVNAMNMWWPISHGAFVTDDVRFLGISAFAIGIGLVVAFWVWAGWCLTRKHSFSDVMFAAAFCSLAFFFFATEMHERYLFPVFIFLPLAIGMHWRLGLVLLSILSISFVANISYVLIPHSTVLDALSGASRFFVIDWWWLWNAAALIIMIVAMWRRQYAKTPHHSAGLQ